MGVCLTVRLYPRKGRLWGGGGGGGVQVGMERSIAEYKSLGSNLVVVHIGPKVVPFWDSLIEV